MGMRITLRTKTGGDVTSQDLAGLPAYPDIVVYQDNPYILKRMTPDKQQGYYYEATTYSIEEAA